MNNIHRHLKVSMNFFGEGEPMHNHESGWDEEALENCGGAVHVRRNIIPKSLTPDFTPKNVTILTLLYFRLKLGINSLHHFQTKRGIYTHPTGIAII